MNRPSLEKIRRTDVQVDRFLTRTTTKPKQWQENSPPTETRTLGPEAANAIHNWIFTPKP